MRSAGSMHRLAQASVASSVLVSHWVQPAGITSLLAWHRQSTTDHRKMFSSDDKQGRPHAATQDQAANSKQPSPDKPQQAGFEASAGWFLSVKNGLLVRKQLEMQAVYTCTFLYAGTASAPEKTILQDPTDLLSFFSEPFRSLRVHFGYLHKKQQQSSVASQNRYAKCPCRAIWQYGPCKIELKQHLMRRSFWREPKTPGVQVRVCMPIGKLAHL